MDVLGEYGTQILTGVAALPVIIYGIWQKLKSDGKGDNVDAKIQGFSDKLQASLDKTVARADQLEQERSRLASENAILKARIVVMVQEIKWLYKELNKTPDGSVDLNLP